MDKDTIINTGFNHGQDLVIFNYKNVNVTKDMDYEEYIDCLYTLIWKADENFRCYSPFELFAYELNIMEDSEAAWDWYDQSIQDGAYDQIQVTIPEKIFEELKSEMFNE